MATITVRLDDTLKEQAEQALKAAGSTPTQAVTGLYHYIAQHGKLPFTVNITVSTPKELTKKIIDELQRFSHYCWMVINENAHTIDHWVITSSLSKMGHELNVLLHYNNDLLTQEEKEAAIKLVGEHFSAVIHVLRDGNEKTKNINDDMFKEAGKTLFYMNMKYFYGLGGEQND